MAPSPSPLGEESLIAGRYRIERRLGSGSVGTVYLARDLPEERVVALKVLRTDRLSAQEVERLQEEFRTVASLEHPHVARAYDFGYAAEGRVPFYTREYIEGQPLQPGPPPRDVPPAEYLRPVLDVLEALQYLHERHLLHLDIHAGNLIVAEQEERGGVLIDFGFAREAIAANSYPAGSRLAALPPEMLRNAPPGPATDLYLAARLLHRRLAGPGESPPRLARELPGWGVRRTTELERVIAKALRPDPEQRFTSAAELRDVLRSAIGAPATHRLPNRGSPHLVARETERRRIAETVSTAASGQSDLVCIVGRSGWGKTRLLEDARPAAQLRGLVAVEVAGSSPASQGPPAVRALRKGARRGTRWSAALDPRHGGTPRERARRAAEAFLAEDGPPLALLVDDLDRLDLESRRLIEALAAECIRRRSAAIAGSGCALLITSSTEPELALQTTDITRLRALHIHEASELLGAYLAPVVASKRLVRRAVETGRGSPRTLRLLAHALLEDWSSAGKIPDEAPLPEPGDPSERRLTGEERFAPDDRSVVHSLAAVERELTAEEVAVATSGTVSRIRAALRRLVRRETVVGRGRPRRYRLASSDDAQVLRGRIGERELRRYHRRLAEWLAHKGSATPHELEQLALHLLGCHRWAQGRRTAVAASDGLAAAGSLERAVDLLERYAHVTKAPSARRELIERASTILDEACDHERGIELLRPFYEEQRDALSRKDRVRLGRRLGIHMHRGGRADEALSVFRDAMEHADPGRELDELVFMDSELAELHLFRGDMRAAREACERGLQRIREAPDSGRFRGTMRVTLLASLGHIELRSMNPGEARRYLEEARRLCREHGTLAELAGILHNLAAAANSLNQLESARRLFVKSQRLLLKIGNRRSVVKIYTNLAVIAAKLGDAAEARQHLDRAFEMVRLYPGEQLEFFTHYSCGLVSLQLGDPAGAEEAFREALPLGRKIGDRYLVAFGEVYLADAFLLCGRYRDALAQLRAPGKTALHAGLPVLTRMVESRRLLIEAILGQPRRARRAERRLDRLPRTGVKVLESWNDLIAGLGRVLGGRDSGGRFDAALACFTEIRAAFACRFARLGRAIEALHGGDTEEITREVRRLQHDRGRQGTHRFLDAAESLVIAEASIRRGQWPAAEAALDIAAGEIVGSPFLELDWRIEHARTTLALRDRDLQEARRHLHRATHATNHMAELVPATSRESFLQHPRFHALHHQARGLERSPRAVPSTERLGESAHYGGMVGRSTAIVRVYRLIEQVKDSDLPVLISGETGTGKELVAKAIYRRSRRAQGPFQVIHAATLPEHLFEAEMFGHEAGAFTDAGHARPGILEQLDGGILVLDEVGDLSLAAQAKLLGVLDTGTFRRLGAAETLSVDVRFLFATRRDLDRAVEEGSFRRDLYYRMRGLEIRVPPLREREQDIPELARHLLEVHASRLDRPVPEIERAALEHLRARDWPGNVRELESVLQRALLTLSGGQTIGERELRELGDLAAGERTPVMEPSPAAAPSTSLLDRNLDEWRDDLERRYLTELFREVRGRITEMARRLGVQRTTLYAWFRKLDLDVKDLRKGLGER